MFADLIQTMLEDFQAIFDRIWQLIMIEIWMMGIGMHTLAILAHDMPRHTNHCAIIRYIFNHHRTSTNLDIVANIDITEHLGTAGDHHIVANSWMTFAGFFAGTAQRNALIKRYIIANNGSLTNYNASAMIDKETFTKLCTWMNLHLGKETCHL